ncbi:MAG: hypothetical protein R2705_12785 [Ilumatobacteraceae bacterium]
MESAVPTPVAASTFWEASATLAAAIVAPPLQGGAELLAWKGAAPAGTD